jgi:hypothetical protein
VIGSVVVAGPGDGVDVGTTVGVAIGLAVGVGVCVGATGVELLLEQALTAARAANTSNARVERDRFTVFKLPLRRRRSEPVARRRPA